MSEFAKDKLSGFLGTVRKYMQVRGPLSQKDLAELAEVGVSTMSRFLNRKTGDLNPQLIARIVASLDIPLHEIIDFVEEDYTEKFVRLVKFYKGDESEAEGFEDDGGGPVANNPEAQDGTAKKNVSVSMNMGNGKRSTMHFEASGEQSSLKDRRDLSLKEKLESLTPRQRAYVTDFLDLDMEGRDLMVDLGAALFRYLRHKGMDV